MKIQIVISILLFLTSIQSFAFNYKLPQTFFCDQKTCDMNEPKYQIDGWKLCTVSFLNKGTYNFEEADLYLVDRTRKSDCFTDVCFVTAIFAYINSTNIGYYSVQYNADKIWVLMLHKNNWKSDGGMNYRCRSKDVGECYIMKVDQLSYNK